MQEEAPATLPLSIDASSTGSATNVVSSLPWLPAQKQEKKGGTCRSRHMLKWSWPVTWTVLCRKSRLLKKNVCKLALTLYLHLQSLLKHLHICLFVNLIRNNISDTIRIFTSDFLWVHVSCFGKLVVILWKRWERCQQTIRQLSKLVYCSDLHNYSPFVSPSVTSHR